MNGKAAFLCGYRDIRIDDAEYLEPAPDEVLVRMKMTTICPTDIRKFNDRTLNLEIPVQLGHEGAGVVEKIGTNIEAVSVGDRVTVAPKISCNSCYYCSKQEYSKCLKPLGVGCSIGPLQENMKLQRERRIGGTFSQFLKVPEANVFGIYEGVDYEVASLTEPLADVLNSLDRAGIDQEERKSVLVVGGGPMGLLHIVAAKARGNKQIGLVEPIEERRNIAEKLGATMAIDPLHEPVSETLRKLQEDSKFDAVFLTVSGKALEQTLSQILPAMKRHGVIVLFASSHPSVMYNFDLNLIHYNSIRIQGVVGYTPKSFEESIRIQRAFASDLRSIVQPIYTLSQIVAGFENYGKPGVLKPGLDLSS